MKKLICIIVFIILSVSCIAAFADMPQYNAEAVVCVNHDDGKPDSLISTSAKGILSNGSKGYTRQMLFVYNLETIEVPDGYILDNAVLSLYCNVNYETDPTTVGIYELVSDGFDYSNEKLTADNIPSRGEMVASLEMPGRVDGEAYNAYMNFDMTKYLNKLMSDNEKYMAVSAIQTSRCYKGGMDVCTSYGDNPPMLTLTFRKPFVKTVSCTAIAGETQCDTLTEDETSYLLELYNETDESKNVRLVIAEVCGSYCVSVDVGNAVFLDRNSGVTLSASKKISDTGNKIRLFVVEDKEGFVFPAVNEKYEFTKDGWEYIIS